MTKPGHPVIKLSAPESREFWPIPVLWEDTRLLALNKPSGLLTSPDRGDPRRSNLITLLHRGIERGAAWAQERHLGYLANANRLDLETSGVILLAKDRQALIALGNQFGAERASKTYVTLVCGTPTQGKFAIHAKLAADPARFGLLRVDPRQGRKATTLLEVAERFSGYTLLKCRPITDRTHQIRAHLRHARLPVVGDTNYGGRPLFLSKLKPDYRFKLNAPERPLIDGIALHLEQLMFEHPLTSATQSIAAPWPKDLMVALKYLRRYADANAPSSLSSASQESSHETGACDLSPSPPDAGRRRGPGRGGAFC
jgi:RluA family pseudouridine synthase